MADNRDEAFSHPIETPFGAFERTHYLLMELSGVYGEARARKMLRDAGAPISRRREQERAGWILLSRYDTMHPKPNVNALARQIAEEDPSRDVDAIERQIARLIARRKEMLAAGKWRGPGAPPGSIVGAIVRITTRPPRG